MVFSLLSLARTEAAGGLVLMAAAVLAMLLANSPMAGEYAAWTRALSHPINDGLMVFFFLLVGLEIKRELTRGELASRQQALLPAGAALGGVALPALIFMVFNGSSEAARGWAIPAATDIAFSLGVLSLLGNRVAPSLKVFLMAVAVIDDLMAVAVIAVFYAGEISWGALLAALIGVMALMALPRLRIRSSLPYGAIGIGLWAAVLFSGVHATLAGVALGLCVPLPMGKRWIEILHPYVAFGVMPAFALANAGVPLADIGVSHVFSPLTLGIAAGLFVGKQIGIFMAARLLVRIGWCRMPAGAQTLEFYGVCILCGIGFTMSLFIGALAFPDAAIQNEVRLGVLIGSLLSAILGYSLLALQTGRRERSA